MLFRMLERVFARIESCSGITSLVFAAFMGGDAHVSAALPHLLVAQPTKRRDEGGAAHVAGELHATRTSSRT